MILELQFVAYIRLFFLALSRDVSVFIDCQMIIPYKEISFLGFCQAISFLEEIYKKNFVFFNHLFRKRFNNQKAALMLQVIPGFRTIFSVNSLFNSAKTNEKYIMSEDYCFPHHDDKTCFLPNGGKQKILMGGF